VKSEPIDYPARLRDMARQLARQGRDPALCAADGLDLRGAALMIDRQRQAIGAYKDEIIRLRRMGYRHA
jgi:hypothetical protein